MNKNQAVFVQGEVTMELENEKKEHAGKSVPRWVIVASFVVLLAFLVLIAWSLRNAQMGTIGMGDKVPPFSLTTFDGNTLNSGDFSGKVILINFWASWCTVCEDEALELETAWQQYKADGEVVFMGVDYVDTEPEAKAYLDKFHVTFPNGPDLGTKISQMFRIRGVPETFIIGRDGKLAYVKIGPFISLQEIQQAIDSVLMR
jgi:cytochrome c biogenesis protein CcmG/thiol:disulfide interchange protein DsbE